MKWDSELSSGLVAGLTVALTALIANWLMKSAKQDPAQDSGKWILDYGLPMKGVSIIFILIFLGILVGASQASPKDHLAAALAVVLFAVITIPLALESFFVRIAFDDQFIYCFSPWRSNRQIPWSAIYKRRFSQSMQWHIIETNSYGYIRVPVFLSGVLTFLNRVDQELKNR